jgi:hypothetical protein
VKVKVKNNVSWVSKVSLAGAKRGVDRHRGDAQRGADAKKSRQASVVRGPSQQDPEPQAQSGGQE